MMWRIIFELVMALQVGVVNNRGMRYNKDS